MIQAFSNLFFIICHDLQDKWPFPWDDLFCHQQLVTLQSMSVFGWNDEYNYDDSDNNDDTDLTFFDNNKKHHIIVIIVPCE